MVNGLLVAKAKIPPLIATLGTLGAAIGLAQIITNGVDLTGVPNRLADSLGSGKVFHIPALVICAAIVSIIGGVVLAWTKYGRYTYAIGSSAEAARRSAISVDRHIVSVYALQGFLAGAAGVLALALHTATTIGSHGSDNLAVITGVVLGGTSLFGGYGNVFRTVIGILIPVVLVNGLLIVGVPPFWQTVAIGVILVVAVYIDQAKRRARARELVTRNRMTNCEPLLNELKPSWTHHDGRFAESTR